jgi:hypothetical protein
MIGMSLAFCSGYSAMMSVSVDGAIAHFVFAVRPAAGGFGRAPDNNYSDSGGYGKP